MTFRHFAPNLKLILLGGLFLVIGLVKGWNILSARFWVETPAVMARTHVAEQTSSTNTSYRLDVSYRWEYEGRTYFGTKYSFDGTVVEESQSKVQAAAARWPEGGTVTCWVNPRRPDEAVLDRVQGADDAIALSSIGTVLLLFAIGGPLWVARGRRVAESRGSIPFPRESLGWGLAAVLLLGTCGGLAWEEWLQRTSAARWVETPCEILESRMTFSSHEFKPLIRFRWRVDGTDHDATTVSLSTFEGNVLDAEKLIAAHPVGSHSVCWRNPHDPSQAVLDRSFHFSGLIFWVLSGILGLACAGAFIKMWLNWRRQRTHSSDPVVSGTNDSVLNVAKAALRQDFEPLARAMPRLLTWSTLFKLVVFVLLPGSVLLQQTLPVILREWDYGVWLTITQWLALFVALLWFFAAILTVRILVSRLRGSHSLRA